VAVGNIVSVIAKVADGSVPIALVSTVPSDLNAKDMIITNKEILQKGILAIATLLDIPKRQAGSSPIVQFGRKWQLFILNRCQKKTPVTFRVSRNINPTP